MYPPREAPDIQTSTDGYARRFEGPVGHWLLDVQWRAVHKLLRDCPGKHVLELGGGHGQITGSLLDHGYNVNILGSDTACARRIRTFLDPARCSFQAGDLLNLPYPDRSFDTVIALRLMAHVNDWPRLLAEATRVARHAVLIEFPTLYSINLFQKLFIRLKKAMEHQTRSFHCFTDRMIIDACRPHGFVPAARQRQLVCPMVLHRVMNKPALSLATESTCRKLGLTHALGSPVVLKLVRAET